jgi:hypothetical protein
MADADTDATTTEVNSRKLAFLIMTSVTKITPAIGALNVADSPAAAPQPRRLMVLLSFRPFP